MAVVLRHIRYYEEIFAIPGLLTGPVLIFGYQDISVPNVYFEDRKHAARAKQSGAAGGLRYWYHRIAARLPGHPPVPSCYRAPDLGEALRLRGVNSVEVLDLFDERASLKLDMNRQVPDRYHGKFRLFIDIGCLEHLFDTRQCLENCLKMVQVGGHYVLHTPVDGHFAHGLHVFNPRAITTALELNGFDLTYTKFTTPRGRTVHKLGTGKDTIMWLVARKVADVENFQIPQQTYWEGYYDQRSPEDRDKVQSAYKAESGRPDKYKAAPDGTNGAGSV